MLILDLQKSNAPIVWTWIQGLNVSKSVLIFGLDSFPLRFLTSTQFLLALTCLLFFPLQNDELRRNTSRMNNERSKAAVRLLHSATTNTPYFFGNDVRTAAQLLNSVLQYESQLAGFELTAMKDSEFNEVENKLLWCFYL